MQSTPTRASRLRNRFSLTMIATLVAAAPALTTVVSPAHAANGLYVGLGLGYGKFSGTQLVTEQIPGSADLPQPRGPGCCPDGGLTLDIRTGFALKKSIAPELMFMGHGWSLGSNAGGAAVVGGGVRLFPLGVVEWISDTPFAVPIDIGLGVNYGWSIVGKDFAYTGGALALDATFTYALSPMFHIGARLGYVIPSYGNFVYTDFGDSVGRCLSSSGEHPSNENAPAPASKDALNCSGSGPSTTFFTPQLLAVFDFDILAP